MTQVAMALVPAQTEDVRCQVETGVTLTGAFVGGQIFCAQLEFSLYVVLCSAS